MPNAPSRARVNAAAHRGTGHAGRWRRWLALLLFAGLLWPAVGLRAQTLVFGQAATIELQPNQPADWTGARAVPLSTASSAFQTCWPSDSVATAPNGADWPRIS